MFDGTVFLLNEVFSRDLYEKYFIVQFFVNLLSGCAVYSFLSLNYDILRHVLCLWLNRPLELMPELFDEPYRAVSPIDFWSRWHQAFKSTWTELIFKPVSTLMYFQCPHLPRSIVYAVSSMCVFLFSGVTHEYFVYITFEKFSGDQITFFLCQGIAVVVEHALKQQFPQLYIPKPVGLLFTFIFNGITAGYFLRPYI
ncbi:unnamed protein product, partial [Adineta ricciae]